MHWLSRTKHKLGALLGLPSADQAGARGGHLLNLLLLGVSAATLLMLVAILFYAATGMPVDSGEAGRLSIGVVITLFAIAGVSTIRRKGARYSWLALVLLLATVALYQLPIRVSEGRSLAIYAIPVILASLLLRPWASFLLAALSCLMMLMIGLFAQPFPSAPALAAFFVLIVVSWLSTRSLEQSLANSRQSYRRLQESEVRYRALFDGVPVGLYRISPTGEFLDANQALVEMLGFEDREALRGRNAQSLWIHPEELEQWRANLERTGIVRRFEADWHGTNGTAIEVQCSARVWRDNNGRIAYYEGSAENVKERKRAERMMKALNGAALGMEKADIPEQIFAVVDQELQALGLHCAILMLDEDGQSLSVEHTSYDPFVVEAAREMTGLDLHIGPIAVGEVDALARAVSDLEATFIPSTRDLVAQVLPFGAEELAGELVDLLGAQRAVCAPLVVEDKVIGVLTVHAPDLTESDASAIGAFAHQIAAAWHTVHLLEELRESVRHLTAAQTQLLQAQKLESIGRLAGGIAHDFSNLLTVMQGHAQLALRLVRKAHPAYKHLTEIQTAATRAARMTGQLLAFGRREILQKQALDLNELIGGFSSMLAHTLGEHIELRLDLASGLPLTQIDGGALERVLMNLVLNARDAMPEGGELQIATNAVDMEGDHPSLHPEAIPGHYVRMKVTDTGVGMDDATMEHLFEPFFSTKEPGSGTGLGLAMAYGIVKQHDGWIDVQSAPGAGTAVSIHIPVNTGDVVQPADAPEVTSLPGGDETVLLAEDEPSVQRFVCNVLEDLGYTVLVAGDGEHAIQLFSEQSSDVDLLVLDARMPKVSGSTACAAMRTLRPDVPVLFITGYSDEIARLTSDVGTSVNILRKPFGPAELAHRVRDVLDELHGRPARSDADQVVRHVEAAPDSWDSMQQKEA